MLTFKRFIAENLTASEYKALERESAENFNRQNMELIFTDHWWKRTTKDNTNKVLTKGKYKGKVRNEIPIKYSEFNKMFRNIMKHHVRGGFGLQWQKYIRWPDDKRKAQKYLIRDHTNKIDMIAEFVPIGGRGKNKLKIVTAIRLGKLQESRTQPLLSIGGSHKPEKSVIPKQFKHGGSASKVFGDIDSKTLERLRNFRKNRR